MATSFVPSSNKRIPGALVTALVTEMGFKPEHISQMWIAHQGITVHLRLPLGEVSVAELLRTYPGVTVMGDSVHVECSISFAIDWEAT
jgi:hypothetical protein